MNGEAVACGWTVSSNASAGLIEVEALGIPVAEPLPQPFVVLAAAGDIDALLVAGHAAAVLRREGAGVAEASRTERPSHSWSGRPARGSPVAEENSNR